MRAYRASFPGHPAWGRVALRVLVYRPSREPEGVVKLVVQVVDPIRGPVAEAPLLEALVPPSEAEAFLAGSRQEGWEVLEECAPPTVLDHSARSNASRGAA